MAGNELIVDNDYCKKMGIYIESQGGQMEELISSYILIMKKLKNNGVVEGKTAKALATYIHQAERLSGNIKTITSSMQTEICNFAAEIEMIDH